MDYTVTIERQLAALAESVENYAANYAAYKARFNLP